MCICTGVYQRHRRRDRPTLDARRQPWGEVGAGPQWISNAYLLTLSALVLAGGAFGDRFGLARVFRVGITLFVGGSVLCAIAPTSVTLIAARAVQGMGSALLVLGSLALIARTYPPGERGAAIGIWAAASAISTTMGPILGGLLLPFGGPEIWRWIFAVNLPLGGVAIWMLGTRVTHDPYNPNARADVPGAVLTTCRLGLIAFAPTGAEYRAAMGAREIALILAGLVALAGSCGSNAVTRPPWCRLCCCATPGSWLPMS